MKYAKPKTYGCEPTRARGLRRSEYSRHRGVSRPRASAEDVKAPS